MVNILFVEDNPDDVDLMLRLLRKIELEVEYKIIETEKELIFELASDNWDIIISDFTLPELDGLYVLDILNETGKDIPFILVSGTIGQHQAVELMKKGAKDYILKDELARLAPAVKRELSEAKIRKNEQDAIARLVKSENRLNIFFRNMTKGVAIFECKEGALILKEINPSGETIFSLLEIPKNFLSFSKHKGKEQTDLLHEALMLKNDLEKVLIDEEPISRTITRQNNHQILWINLEINKMPNNDIVVFLEDISSSKAYESKIEHNLKEKEMMLHEIHHRVKNNMQIIISLLRLKSKDYEEDLKHKFIEVQSQIRAMALIHETLYESQDFVNVKMDKYLKILGNSVLRNSVSVKNLRIDVNANEIFLNIEKAIPCGLIINELIQNSIEYSFTEEQLQDKIITITMKKTDDNNVELLFSNNGKKFRMEHIDDQRKQFGLQLVSIMATKQLHGKVEIGKTEGFRFKVIFDPVYITQANRIY